MKLNTTRSALNPQGDLRDQRDTAELEQALALARHTVYKQYLDDLSKYPLIKPNQLLLDEEPKKCIRAFRLTQLTCKKGEDVFQKLSTVYHAAMSLGCSLFVMVDVSGAAAPADIYLGLRNPDEQPNRLRPSYEALREGLLSNFPGTQVQEVSASKELSAKLEDIFGGSASCVAAVSCVASARDKAKTEHKGFVQGIEKLIDTMRGKAYTALFIAEPVSSQAQSDIRRGYESLYSTLSAFRKSVWSYNASNSHAVMESLSHGISTTITEGTSHTQSHTITQTKGEGSTISAGVQPFGIGASSARNKFNSTSDSRGTADTSSQSKSEGDTKTTSNATTDTVSAGQMLQIERLDKSIEEMLARIEEQLKRTQEGEDYGAYSCGAYFLSSRQNISLLAANTYRALMMGDGSSVERGAVNFWDQPEIVKAMKEYLRRFAQPIFSLPLEQGTNEYVPYSPGTIVSGLELPLHLGLPTRSVMGLPVIDHAEFGRNVMQGENALRLGRLYHMGQIEQEHTVCLEPQSLTAHTFITGSTGSGKSNTIYTMLEKLCLASESKTHFLVIEPAKGEYKESLGGYPGVSVFGTNPYKTSLLRLNPFSFPEDTHVLEHIDRLVEVFNACWPMYAAMPAVLKAAIERAYQVQGWNLNASRCAGTHKFPTFRDVMRVLPDVVDRKGFSNDTQGDYKGALLTRIESLTNGIIGQVLCAQDELPNEALFDRNTIVDLSRVGSSETKSLLMGVLILKLQEYRMAQRAAGFLHANHALEHITVLEEAHNLLRRTAIEQNQESSNLQGKSVEMLTNAIAEMRTYGESFIISDQSPALLDMAAIRNTNTKIVLRLPDEGDRMLVGKAMGLNDDQIAELSRLDIGVAAIYQSHWVEPVLCKVTQFTEDRGFVLSQTQLNCDDWIYRLLLDGVQDRKTLPKEKVDHIKTWIDRQEVGAEVKRLLVESLLRNKKLIDRDREYVLYCLAHGKRIIEDVRRNAPMAEECRAMIDYWLMDQMAVSEPIAQKIREGILLYAAKYVRECNDLDQYQELMKIGGVC